MPNLKIDTNSLSTSLGIINNTKSTFTNSYNSIKNISSVLVNQGISVSFVQILNNLKNNQSQINKIITDIDNLITNYEKLNKQINTLGGTVVSTSPLTASSTDQNIEITTNSQSITKKDIDKAKEEYDEIKKSIANQEEQIAYLEGTHYGQNITDWDEEDREKLTVYQRNLDKLKDTQAQKYNAWSNLNNSFYKVDAEYNTSKLKKDAEAALFRGNEATTLEETKIQAQLNHILTYTEGTVANLTDNQHKSIGENYTNKAEKLRNELINVEKEIAKLKDSIKTEFLHDREKDATSNLKQLEKQKLVLESNLSSVYAILEVLGLNDTNYRYEDVIQDTENNIAKENIIITEESIYDLKNTIADLEDQLTIAQNKLKEYNNQPLHERGDTSTLEEQISSIQEQIKTSKELLKTSKMGYYKQLSTNENYELESKCKTQKISDYNFDNKTIKINGIVTSLSNIDLFTLVDYTINQNNLELYQLVLENASIPDGVKLNKYKNDYLPYLKDYEKEQYYYILNTKGLAQAEEYLADQEKNVADRKGYLEAQEILNGLDNNNLNIFDTIVLAIKGASGGLDNFYDGISNLVFADGQLSSDDYRSMYLLQGLIDKYGEETVFGQYSDTKVSSVMIAIYEIYTSIGNMMPSMIAGVIGGLIGTPALGSALMFASTTGNSKEKALQMGYTEDEANLYGLLIGLSETALEYFLGGIPGLSKLSEIKGITAIIINILKEGREESIQEVIDWLLQGIISGEFQELSWENVIKSGLYGMITAGLMSGGTIVIESIPVDSVYLLERYTKEELEIINDYIIKNPELTKSVLQAIGQNGEIDLSNVDTTQIVNLLAKIKPDFVEQIINTKETQTTNNHNVEQIVEKVNDEVELSTNNEIVEPNITIPKIVEKAKIISKRIGGGIGLAGLAFLDIGITTINPILGGIFTLATLLPGNLLFGNKGLYASDIKDSSFSVLKSKKVLGEKVYYISQNLSLSSILKAKLVNNQQQFFIIEALNCFQQMKTRNADGNKIKYGTKSQGYTKILLRNMERGGYITNFNSDKVKSSNLTLERFLFGVKQRKKPITMHEMIFELTDKPINSQFINEMITKYDIDITNYNQIQKGDMTILKLKTFKLLKDKIAGLFNKNNNNVESKIDINTDSNAINLEEQQDNIMTEFLEIAAKYHQEGLTLENCNIVGVSTLNELYELIKNEKDFLLQHPEALPLIMSENPTLILQIYNKNNEIDSYNNADFISFLFRSNYSELALYLFSQLPVNKPSTVKTLIYMIFENQAKSVMNEEELINYGLNLIKNNDIALSMIIYYVKSVELKMKLYEKFGSLEKIANFSAETMKLIINQKFVLNKENIASAYFGIENNELTVLLNKYLADDLSKPCMDYVSQEILTPEIMNLLYEEYSNEIYECNITDTASLEKNIKLLTMFRKTLSSDILNNNYYKIYNALLEKEIDISDSAYNNLIVGFTKYLTELFDCKDVNIHLFNKEADKNGKFTLGGSNIHTNSIIFNTKTLGKNAELAQREYSNNIIDNLDTIFHEVWHHSVQSQEMSGGSKNYVNLISTIERIIREKHGNYYYGENYQTISYEIDARYNARLILNAFLGSVSKKVQSETQKEIFELLNAENVINYNKNNSIEIDGSILTRDLLFDQLLLKNPDIYAEYPILQFMYRQDTNGNIVRKNIADLYCDYYYAKTEAERNLILNIINNSTFTVESCVDALILLINCDESLKQKSLYSDAINWNGVLFNETIIRDSNLAQNIEYFDVSNQYIEQKMIDYSSNETVIKGLNILKNILNEINVK